MKSDNVICKKSDNFNLIADLENASSKEFSSVSASIILSASASFKISSSKMSFVDSFFCYTDSYFLNSFQNSFSASVLLIFTLTQALNSASHNIADSACSSEEA